MKKSSSIKLVLIGAALASCNRIIIPSQSPADAMSIPVVHGTATADSDIYYNSFNTCCQPGSSPCGLILLTPTFILQTFHRRLIKSPVVQKRTFLERQSFYYTRWLGKNGEAANS